MVCDNFFCRFRDVCLEYPSACDPFHCDALANYNYNIAGYKLRYNYEYCAACESVRFSCPDDASIIMRCALE